MRDRCPPLIQLPVKVPGKVAADGMGLPAMYVGALDEVLNSWHWPGPSLVTVAIWRVNVPSLYLNSFTLYIYISVFESLHDVSQDVHQEQARSDC